MLSATVPCAVWFNINNPQDKLALGSKIKPGNRTGTCSSNQRKGIYAQDNKGAD